MYDIAIIGLGPAGANLARLLSQNFKVIAINKSNQEGTGFCKPCGGLLAPDAQKILAKFNLTLPKSILVDPQIFSVKTIDVNANKIRNYQRFYLNMDRAKFDQWLRSLIPSNVKIIDNACCTDIEQVADGFELNVIKAKEKRLIKARFIIGADGANSIVRRVFYPKLRIRKYVAIQQWFTDCHPVPFYSSIFDSDTTDCYAWGLPKDNNFIFGGAFAVKHGREKFEKLKQKMAKYGFKLENPQKTEACLVLRPTIFQKFNQNKKGVFLIGEAAGFISPSSLEGISYALQSSYELSNILNKNTKNPNKSYKRIVSRIRRKLLLKNIKSPFIYYSPFRKLIMKSAIKSISTTK
jgi:Dehydrogenases (flavoproteins)